MDPYTPEGKAAANIAVQSLSAALDSPGICSFTTFGIGAPELLAMLSGATEFGYHLDEIPRAGERIWNLERLFNQRIGLSRKDDPQPRSNTTRTAPEGSHFACFSCDGRCLGVVLWNACDDLGILGWFIGTRGNCSRWEDRAGRGESICADTLGLKQARGPPSLFRTEETH
jgi:hypothetical protein